MMLSVGGCLAQPTFKLMPCWCARFSVFPKEVESAALPELAAWLASFLADPPPDGLQQSEAPEALVDEDGPAWVPASVLTLWSWLTAAARCEEGMYSS